MIAALVAGLVLAQAGGASVLTLDEALKSARSNNLDLKVAQARLEQAQENSAKTWANYLPRVTAGGALTLSPIEVSFPLPTGGEAVIQKKQLVSGQIQLDQAILAPSLIPAIQAANLGEKNAELSIENARRELLFAVTQVYFGAAGLQQAVAVQQRQLESNLSHERDAKVRFDAGTVPRLLLLRAQIDRSRSEQDLKRAENQYASMKSQLAALLNREPDFDVVPPPELPLPPERKPDELENQAVAQRPDVAAARVNVEVNDKQLTAATLRYLPSLGLSARYQGSNVSGFAGQNAFWQVSFGLNWTLFDGGLREAERREASARLTEASLNAQASEVKARDEVRRALLELDSARANRVKAEEQLVLARENMKLVNVNFQAGVATQLEVSDANTALLSSELGAVAETLNAQLSVLRLAKAAGSFEAR